MGKTPVVNVNDRASWSTVFCSLILVGFIGLVRDGADFQKVDKVMERFGWPMGPAYLLTLSVWIQPNMLAK